MTCNLAHSVSNRPSFSLLFLGQMSTVMSMVRPCGHHHRLIYAFVAAATAASPYHIYHIQPPDNT